MNFDRMAADMRETERAGGDILVYAKIRDPDARHQVNSRLEDLPEERVSSTLYEVATAGWDEGVWDEEVERLQSYIDPATDTLIFWQVGTANSPEHASRDSLHNTCESLPCWTWLADASWCWRSRSRGCAARAAILVADVAATMEDSI